MKNKYIEDNMFSKIMHIVYWGLMGNLGFALTNLPFFLALTLFPFSFTLILLYIVTSLTVLPGLFVVFCHFENYYATKTLFSIREYLSCWLTAFKKIALISIIPTFLFFALYVSINFTAQTHQLRILPLIYFFFAVVFLGSSLAFIYLTTRNPDQPFLVVFKTAIYVSIRKWYISLLNIFLLAILFLALVVKPIIGFFILPTIISLIIYKNSTLLMPNSEKSED